MPPHEHTIEPGEINRRGCRRCEINAERSAACERGSSYGVPREAVALTLFRILPNGEPRAYSATTFPQNPYRGCERMVRMAHAVGWDEDREPGEESYGLLEVLDARSDIIANYDIPNARAFAALKKKLDIVVEPESEAI